MHEGRVLESKMLSAGEKVYPLGDRIEKNEKNSEKILKKCKKVLDKRISLCYK